MNSLCVSLLGRGDGLGAGNPPRQFADGQQRSCSRSVSFGCLWGRGQQHRPGTQPTWDGWHSPVRREDLSQHRGSPEPLKTFRPASGAKESPLRAPRKSTVKFPPLWRITSIQLLFLHLTQPPVLLPILLANATSLFLKKNFLYF